jgi:hypothetical protein
MIQCCGPRFPEDFTAVNCIAPFTNKRVSRQNVRRLRAWSIMDVKGRKRHILVDTLGLPTSNRVEPGKRF